MSMYTFTAAIVVVFISLVVASTGMNNAFAGDYEKSQTIVQTNECGNYWFPLDILCSNLNSQVQGDENSVTVASAQQQQNDKGNTESSESYAPPFP